MEYITTVQFAELKGCTVQYARKYFRECPEVISQTNPLNNRPQSLIPISALPQELQSRYYGKLANNAQLCLPKVQEPKSQIRHSKSVIKKEFGQFNADEREQIAFWTELIREWRVRRCEYTSLAEGDMCFIAETKRLKREYLANHGIAISKDILYRKYKAYKENDLQGLVDNRGAWNKGKSNIPKPVLETFYNLYLCDNELPVRDCYKLTMTWTEENYPEYLPDIAGERTFRRQIDSLPEAVVKFFRKSQKECIDECLPYIERLYEDIEANDVWVADNHTFDFVTMTENGERQHRLHITGMLDAKSGALVGWNITENPSSHSTVLALRHAIMRCGIPKMLYVDNGTEFLTHDIGGKGHRSRKSQENIPNPPTILDRLGIKMVNALVCNGRAKPIERMFLTLKNTISRTMATFTGGNIIERPESLKYQLKHGYVPYDCEIREKIDILLDGQYNSSEYGGYEKQFKGLSHSEAWCKSIKRRTLRMCDESTLDLLLMRSTRYQKVRENGVYITISGERLWYNSGTDSWRWVGQEVYVRYDPSDLEYVRIYDKDDTYIGNWKMDLSIFVDYITSNQEDIAARQALVARQIRQIKECGAELMGNAKIDALALAVAEAHKNIDKVQFKAPTFIEPITIKEAGKKAVGAEEIEIDLEKMAERAAKRKISYQFEED